MVGPVLIGRVELVSGVAVVGESAAAVVEVLGCGMVPGLGAVVGFAVLVWPVVGASGLVAGGLVVPAVRCAAHRQLNWKDCLVMVVEEHAVWSSSLWWHPIGAGALARPVLAGLSGERR